MRWFLAGLAFASVVGLGIATAAIEARNIRARQRIQQIVDRLDAAEISVATERLRLRDATELRELVVHWLRLQELIERRERRGRD